MTFKTWGVNSLANDKSKDLSKLKAFADDIINETEKQKFVLGCIENIAGKGENAFKGLLFSGSSKVGIM